MVGADRYRILVRKAGAVGWSTIPETFAYPAGQDKSTDFLSPDDYEWMVEAYIGSTPLAGSAGTGAFTIASLSTVTGQRAALTGTAMDADVSCQATLPSECQNLRQTPVLDWDSTTQRRLVHADHLLRPGAHQPYGLHDARQLIPLDLGRGLPRQSGGNGVLLVRPTLYRRGCLQGLEYAEHAFNKKSNPVALKLPIADAVVQDDVTFTWDDYLLTNTNAIQGDSALATKAGTEAREYRVQVSSDPNFQSTIENVLVDQRSFTSFANTYPEGNLYWRVQAIDQSATRSRGASRARSRSSRRSRH